MTIPMCYLERNEKYIEVKILKNYGRLLNGDSNVLLRTRMKNKLR